MTDAPQTARGSTRIVPLWQPRTVAAICFATGGLLALATIFPVRDQVDLALRLAVIGLLSGAGLACWLLARRFRTWSVHLAIAIALLSGFAGAVFAGSQLSLLLNLSTTLWVCILIGLAFPPRVTRTYAVLIGLGLVIGIGLDEVEYGAAIGLLFAVSFFVTMEILSRMTTRLRLAATTDSLTGFLNRNGLERAVLRVRSFRRDDRVSLLMVDLDGFKAINDRDGHLEGDRELQRLAGAWRDNVRSGDLIGRIGGDEFVVVFPQTDLEAARPLVARLREVSDVEWSGGVVVSEPGESLESIIGRADRLLYAEKSAKQASGERAGPDPAG